MIFVQEEGSTLSPEILVGMRHLGTTGNKDGMGVMWVEHGRVRVEKSLADSDLAVVDMYNKYAKGKACAVHQRNQTLGKVDIKNVHPFKVTAIEDGDPWDIYMMHNGTIRDIQVDPSMADSYNFATYFLRPWLRECPEAVRSFNFQRILAGLIGNSKLVFLSATGDKNDPGRFTVVNSGKGRILKPGIWVSRLETITGKEPATSTKVTNVTPVGFRPQAAAGNTQTSQVPPLSQPPPPSSTATEVQPLPLEPPTPMQPGPDSGTGKKAAHTGTQTPIQVGAWVMRPNGLKVFRAADAPDVTVIEPAQIELPPVIEDLVEGEPIPFEVIDADVIEDEDEEQINLEVLSMMSEQEIELVVEEQPNIIAAFLHRIARAF